MNNQGFELHGTTILEHLIELKEQTQYKLWTPQQNIDKLTAWMASMSKEEKAGLSGMGAMRLSRKHAMEYMRTNENTQYIYTMMVEQEVNGQ
eukprot:8125656-Heterocapsa_arctica.AAC.1